MKEFIISKNEERQRFSKYLGRLLTNSGSGFIYKMLRKKNITLNDLKADGTEMLVAGDVVKLYLSDETFAKFSGISEPHEQTDAVLTFSDHPTEKRSIAYENEHMMLVYKPAGVLSQKDDKASDSLNEQVLQYLANEHKISAESLRSFKPGICNRLDRNTPGLVLFAKTLPGMQILSEALKERTLKKYYLAIVFGRMSGSFEHKGFLLKNTETNTVEVLSENLPGSVPIHTKGRVLSANARLSVLEIELVTGKSHQIRSVLEHLGHPILGDPKYMGEHSGDRKAISEKYGIRFQMLLCYRYVFPKLREPLKELSDEQIISPIPKSFNGVLTSEFPDFKVPRRQ